MYTLRPYQEESVQRTVSHFQKSLDPAVVVLPTGAGKSLVIAELARIARGRVLVLAHVKELVEQNHAKYESYDLKAGIYSAGLSRKDSNSKVIFGSIQSVARAKDDFFKDFSLLIIDECHRVSLESDTQYQKVISKLQENSNRLCILGLTATPYRLAMGWIYNYHYHGIRKSELECFFKRCVYELPLSYMIRHNYLTPPIKIDSPVACYDFSSLEVGAMGRFEPKEIEEILFEQKRATPGIIAHIVEQAKDRKGVMIFTSTVRHAKEIMEYLPEDQSTLVVGETNLKEREEIISRFKRQEIKFLVNVSVLTTGFDAPHVDLIAILRPTESISLYQQIVGRGLRLFEGKKDCLILDYTGQDHDIFMPEVGETKPSGDSEIVQVLCPLCGHGNIFWGKTDETGAVLEHYGRKCQGAFEDEDTGEIEYCDFRYRFKECEQCGCENDIAARNCRQCQAVLVDPDKKLKEAMELKDAHVLRCDHMTISVGKDKNSRERLEIRYYDVDANYLSEFYLFESKSHKAAFFHTFTRYHLKNPGAKVFFSSASEVAKGIGLFRFPKFVIARKKERFWKVREKVF